jgi:hypothetical protein
MLFTENPTTTSENQKKRNKNNENNAVFLKFSAGDSLTMFPSGL